MKKVVIAAMAVAIMAGFSSCQKDANNCQSCGFNPSNNNGNGSFTPSSGTVSVQGVLINTPNDPYNYGATMKSEFQVRCENHSAYAVTPFDESGFVVCNGSFGPNTNQIWTYVQTQYGWGKAAIDGNLMSPYGTGLHVGSEVTVTISFDVTRPFALIMNPNNVKKGENISKYNGTEAIYMKI